MVLLALLLLAAPAAQPAAPVSTVTDTLPTTRGTMGVTFFLPGGGDNRLIGGTYFLANDLALRVDFGLAAPLKPSGQPVSYSLGAGLRFYGLKHDRVAVFVQPDIALGKEQSPSVSGENDGFFTIGAGLGVEYFFTNWFSAGGILALSLKLSNLGNSADNPTYITVGTGTSSLSANFYF